MSLTLIDYKLYDYTPYIQESTYDYIYWGKCQQDPNDPSIIHQTQWIGTCKDYIVDATIKEKASYVTEDHPYADIPDRTPGIYVCLNPDLYKNMLHNLNNFFDSFCKKNGYSLTTITEITNHKFKKQSRCKDKLYFINGDEKWISNACSYSIYLSMIRMLILDQDLKEFYPEGNTYSTKDKLQNFIYPIKTFFIKDPKLKNFEKYIANAFNNPTLYTIPMPNTHHFSGYKYKGKSTNSAVYSHGMYGLLQLMNRVSLIIQDITYSQKEIYIRNLNANFFAKELKKLFLNDEPSPT
jgi:hypothetical protein